MAKPPISTTAPAPELPQLPDTYEVALRELEALVRTIESGAMPLDNLLASYQRGAQLLQFCREKLQAIETQVKVLDATVLKPWTSGGATK